MRFCKMSLQRYVFGLNSPKVGPFFYDKMSWRWQLNDVKSIKCNFF